MHETVLQGLVLKKRRKVPQGIKTLAVNTPPPKVKKGGSMRFYRCETKPGSSSTLSSHVRLHASPRPLGSAWPGLADPETWKQARTLVGSHVFQASIVLCIVFNTVLLCLDSYPEDPGLLHVTEVRTTHRPNQGDIAVLQ